MDTWEEVVSAQLKSDWLTQLDAMSPTIPQIVRKNYERDQKHRISDPSTLDNLIKKREKDAIYFRTQYVKNFPQMGDIWDLIKKGTPIYVIIKIIPTLLLWQLQIPMNTILVIHIFHAIPREGKKLMGHVPCTSIFMM